MYSIDDKVFGIGILLLAAFGMYCLLCFLTDFGYCRTKHREIRKERRKQKKLQKYNKEMKIRYEKFSNLNYNLDLAKGYKLIDDFLKRAKYHPHCIANEDTKVKIKFSGDSNKFNGFLVLDKDQQPKQFIVLVFEEKTFELELENGDNLYYLNCEVI